MGSYSCLYIGDQAHDWKGHIPDPVALIFAPAEYTPKDRLDPTTQGIESSTDEEDETLCSDDNQVSHWFKTTVGKARVRLGDVGITERLLRNIYFTYYSLDFDQYIASLRWNVEDYLVSRLGDKYETKKCDRMTALLLRHLKRLNPDEEWDGVLCRSACRGTREDYSRRMQEELDQLRIDRHSAYNPKTWRREYFRDFLRRDPYFEDLEFDSRAIGPLSFDLEVLYDVGVAIYASQPDTALELDVTELIDHEEQLPEHARIQLFDSMRAALAERARHFHDAFGSLKSQSQPSAKYDLDSIGRGTSQEKGDQLEALIESIFAEDTAFSVRSRVRTGDQEIDLLVINRQRDPFWVALNSPLIFVECRNRRQRVQAKELRDFEVKLLNSASLCRIGFLISTSGFTRECIIAAKRMSREGHRVCLIDRERLQMRTNGRIATRAWLEEAILASL